jgi:P27 family predicted phage terminase small subunit
MKPGPKPKPIPSSALSNGPPDVPECPAHLSGLAAEMWHQALAWLIAARTWDRTCLPQLERYSLIYGRWREAEARVAEQGIVVPAARTGTAMPNQWLWVARGEADRLLRLESELGFGPAARSRVTKLPDPNDPFQKLFVVG